MNSSFRIILYVISLILFSCKKENLPKLDSYKGNPIEEVSIDNFVVNQMELLKIPGISIAIIDNGKITYDKKFGVTSISTKEKVTKNSVFEAASLSKPIFAYFVMKLSEKGIIDLDRPLYFYLPDEEMEKDERYKNITARMVLNHSTGFPNWRWFDKLPEASDLNRGDFFMINDPNTEFTYSGEAYQYLARVIAHLNFVNMYELNGLFQQEVAKPLKMEHAYFVWDDYLYDNKVFGHKDGKPRKRSWGAGLPHQNSKIFNSAGGLHTDAKSYATFLISIINKKGLFPETYKEMLSPYTKIPNENPNFQEDGITWWSLGFGIKPMKNDTIYRHGGSNSDFQSEFAFSINKKFGYVFFMNCDKGNQFNEQLERLLEIVD